MIRILYFSTANADIDKADVDTIVDEAATANKLHNITGALAYNGRNFCQCLEGEESKVRKLIELISKDTRHSGFKLLDEKPVETRHFGDWSMLLVDALDFSKVVNAMSD